MNLREIGGFGHIARINKSGPASSPQVFKAIGDDAGVFPTDERSDFHGRPAYRRRSFRTFLGISFQTGRKSLAANISDLAAVGAIPRWALISQAVPPHLNIKFLEDLFSLIGGISPLFRSSRLQDSKLWPKDGLLRSPPHRRNRTLGSPEWSCRMKSGLLTRWS